MSLGGPGAPMSASGLKAAFVLADTRNLTADARGNEGDVTVHECIVGRNGVESLQDPRNANHKDGRQNHSARCSKQHFSPPRGLLLLW